MAQRKTEIAHDPAHTQDPTPLPQTRVELLALHRETRRAAERRGARQRRSTWPPSTLLGRIEVEVARLERAMDPPLV